MGDDETLFSWDTPALGFGAELMEGVGVAVLLRGEQEDGDLFVSVVAGGSVRWMSTCSQRLGGVADHLCAAPVVPQAYLYVGEGYGGRSFGTAAALDATEAVDGLVGVADE